MNDCPMCVLPMTTPDEAFASGAVLGGSQGSLARCAEVLCVRHLASFNDGLLKVLAALNPVAPSADSQTEGA